MQLPKLYKNKHLNKQFDTNKLSEKLKSILSHYDDQHLLKSAVYLEQILNDKLNDNDIERYNLSLLKYNSKNGSHNAYYMSIFLEVFDLYSRIDDLSCYFGKTLPEIDVQIEEFNVVAKRLKGYMEDGIFYQSAVEYISAYEQIKKTIQMMPAYMDEDSDDVNDINDEDYYIIYLYLFQLLKDYIKEEYVRRDEQVSDFNDLMNFAPYIDTVKLLDITRKTFGCYNTDYIHTSEHFNTVGTFLLELPAPLLSKNFINPSLQEMGVNVIELNNFDLALDNLSQLEATTFNESEDDDEDDFDIYQNVREIIEPLIDLSQQMGLSPNFVKYISEKYKG